MAESSSVRGTSVVFAKKVQRQLSRGKEKVLQRLGKSLETRDDQFERYIQMFSDQQTDGNRIYKDLRNYVDAIRDMREASRRLSQSLFDVYENDWAGEEDLGSIVEGEDLLWNDHEVKLLDQAVRTMESYVGQFPEMREKIAKRGRKLVDYDSSLHHLDALQTAKKRDDIKIKKAKEEMKAAKSVYDGINAELKEELPVLYDSRIGCYVAVFSAVSSLRDIFYKEMSTLNLDLLNVMKELQAQHPDKVFAVRGLQRYGSLKRRSLMSPKAWKASFSDFHRSYSPMLGPRYSFRSPNKPRHSSLSRESSSLRLPSSPQAEPRELDGEAQSSAAGGDAAAGSSAQELKSAEDCNQPGEERGSTQQDEPERGEKAPSSESSSELNNSCESGSLDHQLSEALSDTLHIEEDDELVGNTAKANGLKTEDQTAQSSPLKEASADKEAPRTQKAPQFEASTH